MTVSGDSHPAHEPVAGVEQSAFTNNHGVYWLAATPGTAEGVASASGFGHGLFTAQAAFGSTLQIADLALATPAPATQVAVERSLFTTETRLFGRVADAASGAGIAGAEVRVVDGPGSSQSVTTQSDGSYFFNLAPGAFTGSVVAAEFSEGPPARAGPSRAAI